MANKRKQNKKSLQNGKRKIFMSMILKSTIIFSTALLIAAVICYITDISYDKYNLIMMVCAVFSGLISGFSFSRKMKKNGILNGIISVLPIVFVTLITTLIITKLRVGIMLPIIIAATLLSGAVSGSAGVNIGR